MRIYFIRMINDNNSKNLEMRSWLAYQFLLEKNQQHGDLLFWLIAKWVFLVETINYAAEFFFLTSDSSQIESKKLFSLLIYNIKWSKIGRAS